MRSIQGKPWSLGDMIKMIYTLLGYLALAVGSLFIFGFLGGVYLGIYIVSLTLKAYNKAAEVVRRIRLSNFSGRN